MITRNDFNEHAFDELIRSELIDQLETLEVDADATNWQLREAFKRVIAYNSVPGTYEGGIYDQQS